MRRPVFPADLRRPVGRLPRILSEFTSAVAMSICDDKRVTRRLVEKAGVKVPDQLTDGDRAARAAFLARHSAVVVKPARGEQGRGIFVGLTSEEDVEDAVGAPKRSAPMSY